AVRTAGGPLAAGGPEAGEDVARWLRDAQLLLRERAEARRSGLEVSLGSRLSASGAVALAHSPRGFALERRRPMPGAPSEHASVGTLFHAWVEEYYGAPSLLDVEGAEDLLTDDEAVVADAAPGGPPDLAEPK